MTPSWTATQERRDNRGGSREDRHVETTTAKQPRKFEVHGGAGSIAGGAAARRAQHAAAMGSY